MLTTVTNSSPEISSLCHCHQPAVSSFLQAGDSWGKSQYLWLHCLNSLIVKGSDQRSSLGCLMPGGDGYKFVHHRCMPPSIRCTAKADSKPGHKDGPILRHLVAEVLIQLCSLATYLTSLIFGCITCRDLLPCRRPKMKE